jgi:hypothetical protein
MRVEQAFVNIGKEKLVEKFVYFSYMTSVGRLAIIFILTILGFGNATAQAKDFTLQENQLTKLYSDLLQNLHPNPDKAVSHSEKFSSRFTGFIKSNPRALGFPFRKLVDSNYVQIKTSIDGNFRIYSWDTWTGGTMHDFKTIYQWRANGKVFTKVPGAGKDDPGSFVSQIFTVVIHSRPHYLAVTNASY